MDDQQEEGQLVVVLSLALPSHNESTCHFSFHARR